MIIRLLPAYIYVFVYGRAECAHISLECTKVKLLILNSFDQISIDFFNALYVGNNLEK